MELLGWNYWDGIIGMELFGWNYWDVIIGRSWGSQAAGNRQEQPSKHSLYGGHMDVFISKCKGRYLIHHRNVPIISRNYNEF